MELDLCEWHLLSWLLPQQSAHPWGEEEGAGLGNKEGACGSFVETQVVIDLICLDTDAYRGTSLQAVSVLIRSLDTLRQKEERLGRFTVGLSALNLSIPTQILLRKLSGVANWAEKHCLSCLRLDILDEDDDRGKRFEKKAKGGQSQGIVPALEFTDSGNVFGIRQIILYVSVEC